MFGHCDKVNVLISSSTNQWPQNHIDDQKGTTMASNARIMEKQGQEQQQQQQQNLQNLRCPRCDSSNTKFCYYNNYSLSQPRHFCKACKRYWTRGGTLRNVPVGGGCRKNKRIKKPSNSALDGATSNNSNSTSNSSASYENPNSCLIQPQINLSSTSNHINPIFFGLQGNPSEMNLQFLSRFSTSGSVSTVDTISEFDLQPQLNTLGLGFSSSGFNPTKQIQDIVTSNSLLSSYSMFGNPSSTSTTSTIASLLGSKYINGGLKDTIAPNGHFQTVGSFDKDLHVVGSTGERGVSMKDVKVEGENTMDWNNVPNHEQNNQTHNQHNNIGLSDPSLYWDSSSMNGNWHNDPTIIGSSVTSLI